MQAHAGSVVALGLQHICRGRFDGPECGLNHAHVQQKALAWLRKALQDQTLLVLQEMLTPNQCMSLSGCA